jgi:predicted dehydrogenase
MEKIKTAVIGAGKVGHTHAQALASLPESEFVAVCGRDLSRTQAFAARYGVKAFVNVGEMIATTGAQVVMICTPHPVHAGPAIAAIEAGAHVLVEKPLASTLQDCDAMIAHAAAVGVKLGVISQRRWYEPVRR